jgi:phosphoribosylformylglycinamidine cyclo-ligase
MAPHRDAGVDYDAPDSAKRPAMPARSPRPAAVRGGRALDARAASRRSCSSWASARSRWCSRGSGRSRWSRAGARDAGINRFADVAYDAVAAIVNDLACVGHRCVNAYFATGSSGWYERRDRAEALMEAGAAREEAGRVRGGESPTPPGCRGEEIELMAPPSARLGGGTPLLGELAEGDEIVLVASSGLHANGASLARLLAGRLPDGYATALGEGRTFGEALLDPSVIYVPLVAELLRCGTRVRYLSHITGHGLLKLMRPAGSFTYRISALPEVPPVLAFLVERAGLAPREAYSTFNMGAGYAVYCAAGSRGPCSRPPSGSAAARCSPGGSSAGRASHPRAARQIRRLRLELSASAEAPGSPAGVAGSTAA